jgi:hypothetical protein
MPGRVYLRGQREIPQTTAVLLDCMITHSDRRMISQRTIAGLERQGPAA